MMEGGHTGLAFFRADSNGFAIVVRIKTALESWDWRKWGETL